MRINWLNVWTGGSAVLLVGTNLSILIMALAWGIGGLLGLAPQLAVVLYAAAAVLALMATVGFARMTHEAEPFFEPDHAARSRPVDTLSRTPDTH